MKRSVAIIASLGLLFMTLLACAPSTTSTIATVTPTHIVTPADSGRAVTEALAKGGGPLSGAFYTCILNEYEQGIPFAQIQEDCETKLLKFPSAVDGGPFGNVTGGPDFDPAQAVTTNCAVGDPTRADTAFGGTVIPHGWGPYSWGKESEEDTQHLGLDKAESKGIKVAYIKVAHDAVDEFKADVSEVKAAAAENDKAFAALQAAQETGDLAKQNEAAANYQKTSVALDEAIRKAKEADEKATKAIEKAKKDPNKKDSSVRDETACEQSLRETREFLWECFRTNWKTDACQQLQAKMHNCPDPEQIYIDPEQGYSCAPSFDAEELKNAWVARCELLQRPVGPDTNPCVPPQTDKPGHYLEGKGAVDPCKDVRIYVDPAGDNCLATIEVKPFGTPDLQQLLVWGLNKFGGPIVVLPSPGDVTPQPGPKPTPGPK